MEINKTKRLGVFRAITRDISPDGQNFILSGNSFGTQSSTGVSFPVQSTNQTISASNRLQSPARKSQNSEMGVLIAPSSFKQSRESHVNSSLQHKSLSGLHQRKIVNVSFNSLEGSYYDSSLNSSGSFSNRSQIMNISTEESTREENEERRKPKKRPLEEGEKLFYVIKLDAIIKGEDLRTTIMIKNIPNKYTQKMLLQTIDKKFSGTYDFLYLPIDFKVLSI
jgi:hypothetical protein